MLSHSSFRPLHTVCRGVEPLLQDRQSRVLSDIRTDLFFDCDGGDRTHLRQVNSLLPNRQATSQYLATQVEETEKSQLVYLHPSRNLNQRGGLSPQLGTPRTVCFKRLLTAAKSLTSIFIKASRQPQLLRVSLHYSLISLERFLQSQALLLGQLYIAGARLELATLGL